MTNADEMTNILSTQAAPVSPLGYVQGEHAVVPTVLSTATPSPLESNVYSVSVSAGATTVGVFFDPVLTQRKEQTAVLNKTIELGFTPPTSSTAG